MMELTVVGLPPPEQGSIIFDHSFSLFSQTDPTL